MHPCQLISESRSQIPAFLSFTVEPLPKVVNDTVLIG
jgi:hypothetical protein